MGKTYMDYLIIKKGIEWRGYRVFFQKGALGRGWDLMFSPNVKAKTWKKQITWFDKNPLL